MFDDGDRGVKLPRDGGKGRQVHIDGKGRENRQCPEQKDQFEAARGRKGDGRIHGKSLRAALNYKQVDVTAGPP